MNRAARLLVALLTIFSVACSGRACGGTRSTPASQAGGDVSALPSTSGASGVQRSAVQLREPLIRAQLELAAALGNQTDPDRLSVADLTNMVERLLAEAEASERTLPRETFDTAAVVKRVGPDPVKLFEWVRDQTTVVPYLGVLRGPTGVLMDRVGNSLDRALLLADLLRSANATVRLAHGTLSREQALGIAQRRSVPTARLASSSADDAAAVAAYATAQRLDEGRLRAAADRMTAASQALLEGFRQRVEHQTREIAAAIRTPASPAAETSEADLEALRDHWWVQVQQGAQWLDLDPTNPDAAPGRTEITAAEVLAPADVPRNLHHDVVIRVVVERWSANGLQESTALEHAVRPGALFGQRLLLQHAPLNSPPTLDLSGDQAQATARLTAALVAQKEWLPALSIGANRPITQASFTASGSINRTPGAARPLAPQAGFGGLLDAFGGGDEPAAEPAGHLTAEWIEYEIRSPGRAPERIRRDVIDLIGPSARARGQVAEPPFAEQAPLQRAMALAGDTEVLVLASHLSREFVRHIANSALLTKRDTLRELVRSAAGAGPSPELTAKLDSVSGELYALALARTTLSPVGDRVFLDRPNVFSFHRRIRLGAAAQVVVSKSLDIVRNGVAVRSAESQEVVTVRLAQGVADTAAEVFALGGNCSGCGPVANVSELRVSAEQHGDSWVSIHRLDDPAWREVTLDANARQRVEDDLRAGYVVLVPPRPVAAAGGTAVGWWRVDPRSGSTLGVMQSGHGQAMTELALQFVALGAGVAQVYSCMGGTVRASPTKTAVCLACGLVTFVVALLAIEGILAGATVAAVRGAAIGGFLTETSLTALCNVLGGAMK